MPVTVRFYGDLKRTLCTEDIVIPLDKPATMEDIINYLHELKIPTLDNKTEVSSCEILINGANIRGMKGLRTELKDGDVIFIVPLVEGG